MDKLIQPLTDILRQYPDFSAKIILIISVIFSVLATAYIALQEQAKSVLKERLETQKNRAEIYASDQNRISEQSKKIQELVGSKMQLILILERLDKEMNEVKRKNIDLETGQQFSKIQEGITKMITANQADVEAVTKAISTQEDRRKAFRASRKEQNKKFNIFNIFSRRN
jgi:predicted RNase H-like nuclease (RuvC/YqgF family)